MQWKSSLTGMAVAAMLVGGVSLASAAELTLTSSQKSNIARNLQSERGQMAPSGFQAKVGAKAPSRSHCTNCPAR